MAVVSRIRNALKATAGTVLDVACPWLARDIREAKRTDTSVRFKYWVVEARRRRAVRCGDRDALENAEQLQWLLRWQSDRVDYYDRYAERFAEWFYGPHRAAIAELVREAGCGRYRRVVEIGCGDGRLLAHLAREIQGDVSFVGVDINTAIVARNAEVYRDDPRLTFVAGSAAELLDGTLTPGTVLVSYGGVMEYLSTQSLLWMLRRTAACPPAAIALVEPVDPDHDLRNRTTSYVFGHEGTLSHNHAHLLQNTGFSVVYQQEVTSADVRWMMILATIR